MAIGFFDGVHKGHQALIEATQQAASQNHAHSAILTFWPHPTHILNPDKAVLTLMPQNVKTDYLEQLGLDLLIYLRFDEDLAAMSPKAFMQFLTRALPQLKGIYVGDGWNFGAGRQGGIDTVRAFAQEHGFEAQHVPLVYDKEGKRVSSTQVRMHLIAGHMQEAVRLLGHPYLSLAPRVEGSQMGRKLGFPTVNMVWEPELQPHLGVYAGWAQFGDREDALPCVLNYGVRPTLNKETTQLLLEAHILEPQTLEVPPGTPTRICWTHFLRPEQTFPSVDALKAQIQKDTQGARAILGL